jgi:hypothetical protein
MQASLVHHPHTQVSPIASIAVDVARDGSRLALAYRVTGGIRDLLLPELATPDRTDELWRHTCLEAFLGPQPGEAYVELNLSPSTQWALYRFTGYRHGMAVPEVAPPTIRTEVAANRLTLEVSIDLADVLPEEMPWCLGLAAVIEEPGGGKSYWALAHPPGPPDFHQQDCFTLQLPPAKP